MASYYENYLTIACFLAIGIFLFGSMLGVARVLQPRRITDEKLSTYECGVEPIGDEWTQGHIRYYVFALLFLVFDIEAVFIFPWAVVMGDRGVAALVEMVVFISILLVGYVWVWKKGALNWE